MYKCWLQLICGALVIFFAGKNYTPYSQFFIAQAEIKTSWFQALLWEVLKAFPECCVMALILYVTKDPILGLSTALGIILVHFIIIAWILYHRIEKIKVPFSFWLLMSFVILLTISITQKLGFGFLKVGLASILLLAGYVAYFRIMLVEKEVSLPDLHLKPMIIYLRFFIATILIIGGAGQVTYASKEIITQLHWSSPWVGALILAPIACFPKLSFVLSKKDFDIEELLQSSIFILGVFVFLIDFFHFHEVVFIKAEKGLFYLVLETMIFSFLILGAITWLKQKKIFSILVILGYLGSFISFSRLLR
ncbi:MAG TPA: hypothetical protein ENG63_00225 [Candidatus Desulfofervidus auxilii]|uniref:Sodium/calcium exchanger membrane region domain-containing protein n=1 Tax=Desulfofervidus auxilii TaxID=1621989 RepID=A0A7C0U1H0_DESA2|nr:hypothetical protein [Candidatus Desulfofervidus auxilii]